MPTAAPDLDKLIHVVREAAERLTPADINRLVGNPSAVHNALAVTARTLFIVQQTQQSNTVETLGTHHASKRLPATTASRRLNAHTKVDQEQQLLNADQFAAQMGLKTRQSVHDRLRKNRIIGWPGTKRGIVLPAEQLDERGRPLPELPRVLPLFSDHYTAWVWLNTPLLALDGETPLALLRAGDSERVIEVAAGDAQGDFA